MMQLPPPFALRPLQLSDIPAVLAIERLSLPTARKESVYRYELAHNRLSHYQGLVRHEASGTEALLGYAGCWFIADEAHVSMIAVAPPWRRRGLGELLLIDLLRRAMSREVSLATLEVRRSNIGAQKLYTKYRFEHVGVRRNYYRDTGEDALLMTVSFAAQPDYNSFLAERADVLCRRLADASKRA
jgi:ribosomal-protein-alanine N-acetyltransferase